MTAENGKVRDPRLLMISPNTASGTVPAPSVRISFTTCDRLYPYPNVQVTATPDTTVQATATPLLYPVSGPAICFESQI